MKCTYRSHGCTYEGSADEVAEHIDYMVRVGDSEHIRRRGAAPAPRCPKQPHLRFDQIKEEFHLVCECEMDVNLGEDPVVPDIVFAWQSHSKMKRREDDTGGPRES